ncbi:MAG: ABC transporter ATP-binding protein, partial [Planctomycetia bacterium]|nr:ABC transporter ATP-binding protein [Planctomycetia bacterium]
MNETVWKLDNVTLWGQPRPRLAGVTVEIGTGATAVLGHSGAGKTSLLNLLVGFERPDSGTIVESIQHSDDRLPMFWCPPGDGLWPHLTVAQHLQSVVRETSDRQAKIAELLAAFNLSDKMGRLPDQLSQGECSRLALARAVASDARVLVLDEPLVHVDPAGSRTYWEILRKCLGDPSRTAVVFSTHSPEVVLRDAQQVICLSEGRAVYSGSVQQLYYSPPSADLAWCLGPANWVGDEDTRAWLPGRTPERRCYRPEEVCVALAEESPLIVQASKFAGSVCELELLDERSGKTRRVFHR